MDKIIMYHHYQYSTLKLKIIMLKWEPDSNAIDGSDYPKSENHHVISEKSDRSTDKPFSVLNIMLMEKSIALNVLSTDKPLI